MQTMSNERALKFIIAGGVLLVVGWLVPLLMVMRIIPPNFLLAFASYALSVGGLAAGLFGLLMYVRLR